MSCPRVERDAILDERTSAKRRKAPPPGKGSGAFALQKGPGSDLLSRLKDSTISAAGLNGSVRNGERCGPCAIATRKVILAIHARTRGPVVRRSAQPASKNDMMNRFRKRPSAARGRSAHCRRRKAFISEGDILSKKGPSCGQALLMGSSMRTMISALKPNE